jgi:preprotein translocase subunit SecG
MQWLLNLLVVVQLLSALAMIGLVLIQHGKGADMGASFGSGSSGSLFGATGSANFLSRSTAVCAALFFCCTLALAHFANDRTPSGSGSSVLDRAATTAPAASAASGAAQIPAGVAPALPAAASSAAVPAPAQSGASDAAAIPKQ